MWVNLLISQKSIEQASIVAGAIKGKNFPGDPPHAAKSEIGKDLLTPEKKINPNIRTFLK